MRHILYKYLTGASMIALTFSLNTSTANATCSAMPSCESMGYQDDEGACDDDINVLHCPFDASKVKCIVHEDFFDDEFEYRVDNVFGDMLWNYDYDIMEIANCGDGYQLIDGECVDKRQDCYDLGYDRTSCNLVTSYPVMCPHYKKRFMCIPRTAPVRGPICNKGDYFYSNNTCSTEYDSTKTVIGLVYNPQERLIMSLDVGLATWGPTNYDVSDVINYSEGDFNDVGLATTPDNDMEGETNTDAIKSAATNGRSFPAAAFCYNKNTGGKKWYLPAAGEMLAGQYMCNVCVCNGSPGIPGSALDKIRIAKGNPSYTYQCKSYFWTSSEYNSTYAFEVGGDEIDSMRSSKSSTYTVLCFAKY